MAKRKKPKTPGPEHTKKAQRYLQVHESGKRSYERADGMLAELAAELGAGTEIPLNETGKKAVIVDRFAEKNLVWQPCAARRYELKIKEA
jgi:hypothetical protein